MYVVTVEYADLTVVKQAHYTWQEVEALLFQRPWYRVAIVNRAEAVAPKAEPAVARLRSTKGPRPNGPRSKSTRR